MPMTDGELVNVWSAVGLNPQLFPKYYAMVPVALTVNGAGSGAVGAGATLTRELSNFPHILYGLRVTNTFALPAAPSDADINFADYLKTWVDNEQTITINMSQQNITAQAMLQSHLVGKGETVWAPFPAPYPLAGGNNITIEVRRTTAYPPFPSTPQVATTPTVHATLLTAEFKATFQSVPTHRVHRP